MKKLNKIIILYTLLASALMLSVYASYSLIDFESLKNLSFGNIKVAHKPANPTKDNGIYANNANPANQPNKAGAATDDLIQGKAFLLSRIDSRLKQLKPFTGKIENMSALKEVDRKTLVKELTAEFNTLKALKENVSNSANIQDIRKVAHAIKTEWLKSRASVALAKDLMAAAKSNQLLADADAASLNIEKNIEKLKASGKDVKPMEKFYTAYSKKVALAKKNVEIAQAKAAASGQAANHADKQKLAKEKDEQLKLAENNIKDAYHLVAEEARRDFASRMK